MTHDTARQSSPSWLTKRLLDAAVLAGGIALALPLILPFA